MKKYIIVIVITILLFAFLGTFIEKSNSDKVNNADSIVMSVESLNNDLEMNLEGNKDVENIICATCRGLVKLNSSNEVILDLAKDLEVSDDGIEYKFTLKDNSCWSNGEKIKTEDIVLYFKSLIQSADDKDIKALLEVYGVNKFKEKKVDFEKYVAITNDENSIIIRLNKRNDDFLTELSKPQYRVRRNISLWDNIKSNYNRIVYSGFYSISEVKEESIKLKSNIKDCDKEIIMIKDENKENSMAFYEVGDRDIVVDVPISQVTRLDQNNKILSSPSGEGLYVAMNSKKMNLEMRKEFTRLLYKAAQEYYDGNQKSVKFSEGSYFEEDMDDVNKLQSRKVSINNNGKSTILNSINIFIRKESVSEDFVRFLINYFKENQGINITYEDDEENILEDRGKFHMALLRLKENGINKNKLFEEMKNVFLEENSQYFLESANVEEKIFNSYIALPIMFIDRNIAVSDKGCNVKLDGNGNVDFSAIN